MRVDGLLHGRGDGSEVASVANFEVAEAPWRLSVREVVEIDGVLRKIIKLYVLHHADDGDIVFGLVIAEAIVAADRVDRAERKSWPCAR